ncbi:Eco57I restriction-modification methylase domain-containing protein [Phocaeicola barnesiae]|uniref:Eco57I restriction-modification methylase domain-containing protein n=1 Tax=Phocaeicola barnesiae TaxID=376804 RepID=UPI0025A46F3C|nr:N-6 DNA methylase [Phocaeicola barnesiae]MDM8255391.1 N-6 DNA methylase [Phocaeicola barnesiae]
MTLAELKNKLSVRFDFEIWKGILTEMFPKVEFFTRINRISHDLVKSGGQVGTIRLDDGRSLAIYTFEVSDNVLINRNRKGLREIAAKTVDQSIIHGVLAFYYSKNVPDYRLTFIAKQTSFNEDGELIKSETAPKRYTFLLGENEPCRTAADRLYELISKKKNSSIYLADVTEAFSVERLNKEFFAGYKAQYMKFLKLLSDTKANRDYVKKLLGRLVFLQFLQKKGWMGVPASRSDWEGGDKNYLNHLIERYEGNDRVLSDVLEYLFFNTLNEKREGDIADARLGENIKIPYLNGGLFEKDRIDKLDIDFPYSCFKELMDFFAMYNFTIDENDPDDSEVGIDPEMLGHIFENLLEDNKDKGAFYTPKEIVQYMCRQSVIQYLKTHESDEQYAEPIEQLINNGIVLPVLQTKSVASRFMQLLKGVKVCDPAIGSGAFPMGILYVLYHAIHHLQSHAEPHGNFDSTQTKRDIIQNNIFGVDIEQGAVDIARLRFWLALVVDAEEPQPLPNLDYKIVCGNSILHRFPLETSIEKVFIEYNKNRLVTDQMSLDKYKEKVYEFTNTSDHKKKDEFRNTIEKIKNAFRTQLSDWEKTKRRKLREQIRDLEMPLMFGKRTKEEEENLKRLKKTLSQAEKEKNDIENNKIYEDSFEWRFEFPALLNNKGNFIGFDIIIGNPPFGAKLSSDEKKIYKEYYSDVHMRTPETYCYFISLAFRLANPNGIVSYIVPNNMFFQNENEKTRSLLLFNHRLIRAINLGDNTFENADVPTCIFIASSKRQENYEVEYSDYRKYNIRDIEWDKNYESIPIELIKTVPAYVLGLSSVNIRIINEIKQYGVLIDSIAEEMASGISTGGDKIFRVSTETAKELNLEKDILHRILVGAEIDSYQINDKNNLIIYTTKDINIDNYDNIYNYLLPHQIKLSGKRETVKGTLPWWCLHWPRYKELFEEPKIIMRQTSDSIRCVYDDSSFYVLDSILVFKKNTDQYCYKYIATVLNSTLIDYLYKNLTQEEGRTFAQVKPANVRKLYIPKATKEEQKLLSILYDYLVFLKNPKQPEPFISLNSMFIDLFEKIVDGCVYELFFREHMKEREIDIMSYLYQKIKSIDGLSDKDKNNTIISVHSDIFMTDNPVRTRLKLFVSRSQEFLKPIIQH